MSQIQLCVTRQMRRFLRQDEQPPTAIVKYLADQLGAEARPCLLRASAEPL
ncbi:DUF4158 domain-containing protein [Sinorhizobium psoraleae]|uniref:DUF4158 domain-containing protein n=1 Tax=Sinorhizobium psoraleae TaxID=520838 RepID=UPI0035E3DD94